MKLLTFAQTKLFESIKLTDLASIERILNTHPELLSPVSYYKKSPLKLAIEQSLYSLPVLKKFAEHGVNISLYTDEFGYNLLKSSLAINGILLPVDIFNYILEQTLKDLPLENHNDFLLNIFAILVQYGNYPQCLNHMESLFKHGINFTYFTINYFSEEYQEYNQQHFPHISLVIESILDSFHHSYPEQIYALYEFNQMIAPSVEATASVKYIDIVNYLSFYNHNPSDAVLNNFLPTISNLNILQKLYNERKLGISDIWPITIARIYLVLLRNERVIESAVIGTQLRTASVSSKILFITEIVKQQMQSDDQMEISYLLCTVFESMTDEHLAHYLHQENICILLDIFLTYNLHKEVDRIIGIINTLYTEDRLDIARNLIQPFLSHPAMHKVQDNKQAYLARKNLARTILREITLEESQLYLRNQEDSLLNSSDILNESYQDSTLDNSVAAMKMVNKYYSLGWLIPEFTANHIIPAMGSINIQRIITDHPERIASVVQYYCNVHFLGFKQKFLQMTYIIKNLDPNIQIKFTLELLTYIENNITSCIELDKKLTLASALKELILVQKIEQEPNHILHKAYSSMSSVVIQNNMEHLIKDFQIMPNNNLVPYNLEDISQKIQSTLFKASILFDQINPQLLQEYAEQCNILINKILRHSSRYLQANSNNLDYFATVQVFNTQYSQHLRKPLEQLVAIDANNIDQTIDNLIKIVNHLIKGLLNNFDALQNKIFILEQALATTFLVPNLTWYTNKIMPLRITVALNILKNSVQQAQEHEFIKQMRESKQVAIYFSNLAAALDSNLPRAENARDLANPDENENKNRFILG